jgi:hypothetical protein
LLPELPNKGRGLIPNKAMLKAFPKEVMRRLKKKLIRNTISHRIQKSGVIKCDSWYEPVAARRRHPFSRARKNPTMVEQRKDQSANRTRDFVEARLPRRSTVRANVFNNDGPSRSKSRRLNRVQRGKNF